MVLVDTSVWIDHFRKNNQELQSLLLSGKVMSCTLVIGEIACGNIQNRNEILSLMRALPRSKVASHKEAFHLIEKKKLFGKGLGYIDIHLLASAILSKSLLWTFDKKLAATAKSLKINYGSIN